MGLKFPCNGICEECKFDDCILTDEQAVLIDDAMKANARYREYYSRNREKVCEKKRNYYKEHKEECIARTKAWQMAHKEQCQGYERKRVRDRRTYQHEYYLKRKEKLNDKSKTDVINLVTSDSNSKK